MNSLPRKWGESALIGRHQPQPFVFMSEVASERRWFWATLMLSSISIVAVVFAFWELVENHFFSDLNYVELHYLYISRGIVSSLLLSFWAAWYVLRVRRHSEEELRASRERYRGLLDASPAAMVLFDESLHVSEWNLAAENLYGYSKSEVLGRRLPIVPADKEAELSRFTHEVSGGERILDQESTRTGKSGEPLSVQLSLLPYDEAGTRYFLEVASDNRERVRLRQTLIEIEKLTSMGMMAAGTAHHLNTPLASMLLRTQMLRERLREGSAGEDLARLENSIHFCKQFVQRLLDFARRPALNKQPEEITTAVDAVLGFLSPTVLARKVQLKSDLRACSGYHVLGDRNEIETMMLILISNALDAVGEGGTVFVSAAPATDDALELRVTDNGCGISAADLQRLFQPFFTTKPPGKGTGLGLSIARNIIKEHGGSIEISSEFNKGTEVLVRLPVHVTSRVEVAN
jgi:PAS domain S-box-containing protein